MTDEELRVHALNVARETEGPKAVTEEVLAAADQLYWWLKTGEIGSDQAPPRPN